MYTVKITIKAEKWQFGVVHGYPQDTNFLRFLKKETVGQCVYFLKHLYLGEGKLKPPPHTHSVIHGGIKYLEKYGISGTGILVLRPHTSKTPYYRC